MLGEPESDVTLVVPGVVRGKQGEVTFAQIAHKAETGTGFGTLVATASYISSDFAFPFGANFSEVAVNVRSGEMRLDKFYALLDCGTPVNPELALGQIYGASMRAIGHSMTEEIIYDSQGSPITRDLQSYGAPKIGDIPLDFQAFLVPSDDRVGPYGAKSNLRDWRQRRGSGHRHGDPRCLWRLAARMAFHPREDLEGVK